MSLLISPDSTVTLHFSIKLLDGSTAENTRAYKKPACFKMGDGNFTENFEKLLLGLKAGDKKKFKLTPEQSFGQPNQNNFHVLPRSQFAVDFVLETGLIVSFQQPNNAEIPGIIREFDEQKVTVDFNHPLSGQTVIFAVEIIQVI